MPEIEGRRIYIHKDAVADYVKTSRAAYAASYALAAVRGAKLMHHHLVANGVEIGAVRPEVADRIMSHIFAARDPLINTWLQGTGYKPKVPYRPEPFLPVLQSGESIVETCYQDDYYTFATSADAAERMFEDREPMRKLRGSIGAGNGPHDLTVISGKLFAVTLTEDNTYERVAMPDSRDGSITATEANTIDGETRASYTHYLGGVCLNTYHELLDEGDSFTDYEQLVLSGAIQAWRRTADRPSYQLARTA